MKRQILSISSIYLLTLVLMFLPSLKKDCWAEEGIKQSEAALTSPSRRTVAEAAPSISIAPAVMEVKAKPGQTFSHAITLWNNTSQSLAFQMEARDVMTHDGKRSFVPAGEVENGIARNAVFSERDLLVAPGSSATTTITVTVPDSPTPRAIVCLFAGKTLMKTRDSLTITGSLGALITFTLSNDFHVQGKPPEISIDRDTHSINFQEELTNTGSDPIVPKGVVAVTNENGILVSRLPLSGHRLLPGESLQFSAEHAGSLKPGKYHAVFLLENEMAFFSNSAEFTVP